MAEKVEQPIPKERPGTTPAEEPSSEGKEKTPKEFLDNLLAKVKKLTGESKKAKLILALLGFAAVSVLLVMVLAALKPRPSQETAPILQPTPTPIILTPTPIPAKTLEKSEEIITSIEQFNPEQKDLQLPVVDLEISL